SLSDSFIPGELKFDLTSECAAAAAAAAAAANTPPPACSALAERFIQQCATVGEENSDLAKQIAAAIFYNINLAFMQTTEESNATSDQLLGDVIEDMMEISGCQSLDSSLRRWLYLRFRMLEIFKWYNGRRDILNQEEHDQMDTQQPVP